MGMICLVNLVTRPDSICFKLQNVFVSNWKMYLSSISKLISIQLQNIFVSNCKMYLFQIVKCICFKLWHVFVLNWKMYLSAKCISLKMRNIFVYFCIFLKLQNGNVFVPNCLKLSRLYIWDCINDTLSKFVNNKSN